MIPVTTFSDQTVALFGLGGSGLVTARALKAGGADVVCFDDNEARVEAATSEGLETLDLHDLDWDGVAALVLSPGVPLTHPVPHWSVDLARNAGVEIIGDVELFCRERRRLCPDAPLDRDHRNQRQVDHHGADPSSSEDARPGRADGRQYRHAGA
jgi:UDP-N-acetylmuramoylalanine--D-glutamate ligase